MASSFTAFYESWIINKENLLEKLLSHSTSSSDAECNDSIAEVMVHYQEYYQQKTRAINENVFLMISPTWLSSYERALLWFSDFKPSTLFPLIKSALGEDLSDEQEEKIQGMRAETRRLEKEIELAMASIQETIAAPPIFILMRNYERIVDGEISELDEAMEKFKESMIRVVENADALRGSTVLKLVEILSPLQTIKFLAGALEFVLRVRKWGLQRDGQSSGMRWDV